MTWENTIRPRRKASRRATLHQQRIDTAETSKKRLSAACQWLIAEAWQSDQVDDAFEYVMTRVHELRKGASGNDRTDNAA